MPESHIALNPDKLLTLLRPSGMTRARRLAGARKPAFSTPSSTTIPARA